MPRKRRQKKSPIVAFSAALFVLGAVVVAVAAGVILQGRPSLDLPRAPAK